MTPATLTSADVIARDAGIGNMTAAALSSCVAQANRHVDADVYDAANTGVANDAALEWCLYLVAKSDFGKKRDMDPAVHLDAFRQISGTNVAGPLLPDLEET